MLPELSKKGISIEALAKKALEDEKILSELLDGILSKTDTIRYNSFETLLQIGEKRPDVLYTHWDYFEELLGSSNNYMKYIAVYIIAALTRADTEHKFERAFDTYYSILDGERTMTAAHVAALSGKIALWKPHLQGTITKKLLNIDKTHRGSQKELVKGYAIEAFNDYFEEAVNKEEILHFVREQVQSKSPKTQKKAKEFLEKWEKSDSVTSKRENTD